MHREKMIRYSLLSCFALLASSQLALALSCFAPDVRQNYQNAKASPHNYYIFKGEITLPEGSIAIAKDANGMPVAATEVNAVLNGNSLGPYGKETPFNHPATLEVECALDWCGKIDSNITALAFVREDRGYYFVELGPCGGDVFPNPDASQISKVQMCLNGESCEPNG